MKHKKEVYYQCQLFILLNFKCIGLQENSWHLKVNLTGVYAFSMSKKYTWTNYPSIFIRNILWLETYVPFKMEFGKFLHMFFFFFSYYMELWLGQNDHGEYVGEVLCTDTRILMYFILVVVLFRAFVFHLPRLPGMYSVWWLYYLCVDKT